MDLSLRDLERHVIQDYYNNFSKHLTDLVSSVLVMVVVESFMFGYLWIRMA